MGALQADFLRHPAHIAVFQANVIFEVAPLQLLAQLAQRQIKVKAGFFWWFFLAELRQPVRQWMEQKASLFDGYAKVYDQHDAVVRALEARDPEAARRAMEEHLEAVGERLARALLERGAK